jgi:predicted nucleic acid-binding protein
LSLVVDASVLVAALVDCGPVGVWSEERVLSGAMVAPELARAEAANVLRRLEIVGRLTRAEADAAYTDLLLLSVEWYPFEPFAERVWELRHNVTCYDAWYVALAESLGLPLATVDARLARAKGPNCKFLTPPR